MRGKLVPTERSPWITRNIPAHAGKTDSGVATTRSSEEHPRACGENRANGALNQAKARNIPAHAGKRGGVEKLSVDDRNIPAHAGKTT